jgi:hypothetical protein
MKYLILLSLLLLTGCPATLQKVFVPVPVSCIKTVPVRPDYPAIPLEGIFEQVRALLIEREKRIGYEGELEAVVEGCR